LVSVSSGGTQGDDDSSRPSISPDGRFVAFESGAQNFDVGDDAFFGDIFWHDRDTDNDGILDEPDLTTTIRVSVANDGTFGNNASSGPSISADGRFVAFSTNATNLMPGDSNADNDILIRDTCQGAGGCTPSTILVSVASDGTQGDGGSFFPAINASGRFVAFSSEATNLVAGDTNGLRDVFVHDRDVSNDGIFDEAGDIATVRVSVASDGTQAVAVFGSGSVSMSANGRFVAFASDSSNLVAGDTNGLDDVFVHDRDTDNDGIFDEPGAIATVRVSVASDGTQGNGNSFGFRNFISPDGSFVAFQSSASTLVVGDTNTVFDIFLAATGF
jgi:Tol biopolymer transport system component